MKNEQTVPCPHCKALISPASLMGLLRMQKLSKKRRHEIAMIAATASVEARRQYRKDYDKAYLKKRKQNL